MIADLTMTPAQAQLWEAANALYGQRWPQVEARISAMTVPVLKQYARTTGVSVRGLTVRAHFVDVVKQGLMRQCADDAGFTAARGYLIGQPFRWEG